jgi:hypothetical protein
MICIWKEVMTMAGGGGGGGSAGSKGEDIGLTDD